MYKCNHSIDLFTHFSQNSRYYVILFEISVKCVQIVQKCAPHSTSSSFVLLWWADPVESGDNHRRLPGHRLGHREKSAESGRQSNNAHFPKISLKIAFSSLNAETGAQRRAGEGMREGGHRIKQNLLWQSVLPAVRCYQAGTDWKCVLRPPTIPFAK